MIAVANTPDPAPSSSSTRPATHSYKNLNNSCVLLDDDWLPGITFNSDHHCSSINSATMPQSIRTTTCMPPPLPQQQQQQQQERDDRRHTTTPEMIPITMRETTTRGPRRPLVSTTTTNQEEQDRQQQEQEQERQQATTTRRRVHFAPPVDEDFLETSQPPPPASSSSSSSDIVALDEPSPPLISAPGALWWQSPELAYMKRYSRWALKNVHQDGGGSDELLGLDRFTAERIANKKRALRLVLLAQRYQPHRRRRHHAEDQHQEEATASSTSHEEEEDENKKDAEYLRMVSRKCSYWTRNIAHALAQRVYIDLYMTPPRAPPDEQQQQQYHQGQEVPRQRGRQMEQETRGLAQKRCFEAINSTSQEDRQYHQEQSIDDSRRVRPKCSSSEL